VQRPRVLFFSPVADFKGGAERSLLDLMSNPFIDAEIAIPRGGPLSDYFAARNIPCHIVEFGAVENVRRPFKPRDGLAVLGDAFEAARQLKRICKESGIDLVHSNGLKAHMINVMARRLGGVPAITHIRDIANTGIEETTWRGLQLASDRMILVSRACWAGGTLPRNVRVIHNGVSCPEEERPSSKELARPVAPLVLGFVGRIHPAKGLHLLLRWINDVRGLGILVELVVRGKFADEARGYEQQIKDQLAKLRLTDCVRFDGFVDAPNKVYEGIDIVCVPSITPDPFPRAVMEAMGRGKIVIATPSGGIPDMIDHTRNGFLAINNCLNEVCHGFRLTPEEWNRWFDAPISEIEATYRKWLTLKRTHGGIR